MRQRRREQRNVYLHRITKRFEALAENSRLGRHRPDLRDDWYSFPDGDHIIFYRIAENAIDIIGAIHTRMDIDKRPR